MPPHRSSQVLVSRLTGINQRCVLAGAGHSDMLATRNVATRIDLASVDQLYQQLNCSWSSGVANMGVADSSNGDEWP